MNGPSGAVDVLIVGSGASAVNAAVPLVQAGLRVRMLDVGYRDEPRSGYSWPDPTMRP